MRLIVGLGNAGLKYANNRHNVGFMAVDDIVHRHSFGIWKIRFHGVISEGRISGEKILILKPSTFMNSSGLAVGEMAHFYKISPDNIIVFHDELDIVPAKLKIKQGGGNGGHNGLRSLDSHLVNKNYWRIRIGIGHPGDRDRVSAYVLSDFSKLERPSIDGLIDTLSVSLPILFEKDHVAFQNKVAILQNPPKK